MMNIIPFFKNFCCKTEILQVGELNKQLNRHIATIKYLMEENTKQNNQIILLQNKINSYEKQIDYSFILENWKEINGDVTTNKYEEMGYPIPLDIRDLLNSTCVSRGVAKEIIKELNQTKKLDELFVDICLKVNNYLALKIKYMTNEKQFKKLDLWLDGDIAFNLGYGDCDLTARFYIRVINDCLSELKMYEYQKYIFLGIGYIPQGGHAWVQYFNPIKKRWDLIEATEEFERKELLEMPKTYQLWFCHNNKKVFFQNKNWKIFL